MKRCGRTILFVCPYYPPKLGGVQSYVFNIAKRLYELYGWRVVVVTSNSNIKTEINTESGIKVYRLSTLFRISNTPVNPLWYFWIKKIIKEERPDVVNAHTPVPFIADLAALAVGETPFVLTYHAGSMVKGKLLADAIIYLYEHTLMKILLRRADHIVCSSDFVRTTFLKRYLAKSSTITPATDTSFFTPNPKLRSKNPTLLFVASLTKSEQYKGLDTLIDVTNKLKETTPEVQLVVVGDGDMRKDYESKVRELGLEETVFFKGSLSGIPLVQEYQKAHIFVLPTRNDSFPTVIIEAMSCGLPVVASNIGGIPSLVDNDKTGFIVSPKDTKIILEKIMFLLRNADVARNYGEKGRVKAINQANWSSKTKEHTNLFNKLMEKKPNIIQLVSYYPPHVGGMEIVAEELSRQLASDNYNVKVISSTAGYEKGYIDNPQKNLHITRLKSTEIAHTPIMWALPFNLFFLPKNSIIHAHIAQAIIPELAILISKIKGFPFIAHFHLDVGPSGNLGVFLPLYKKIFLGFVLRNATKVIVLSEEQSSTVKKLYKVKGSRIEVVPNGVNKKFMVKDHKTFSDRPLQILYVGRLNIQKQVVRLIKAMRLLEVPAELHIVGDGEDRKKLEETANLFKLTNVYFEGKKYDNELRSFYKKADVFAISSDQEGFPLVILEAMASGLPIVGSNVTGIREIVKETGVLVSEPYDKGFSKEFSYLYKNFTLLEELSKKSLKKSLDFSWEKITKRVEKIYENI